LPPSVAALIPARGGSKGLPRKNLRLVAAKPLIAHSIEAALGSRCVDHVFVSTEDPEIAAEARRCGAHVIERPPALATDTAQNDAVALHMLECVAAADRPDVLVLLQPTSPLRTASHIDECLGAFLSSSAESAMSICAVTHHPGKYLVRDGDGIKPYADDWQFEARRQQLEPVYRQNGAIYAVRVAAFLEHRKFYLPPCLGYLMDERSSIDIDGELDLKMVELLAAEKRSFG